MKFSKTKGDTKRAKRETFMFRIQVLKLHVVLYAIHLNKIYFIPQN